MSGLAQKTAPIKAPFPWFGGKSRVAHLVWERFADVPNYVEPFAGSLAVLLGRPHKPRTETVNDLDGFVANFWRAVQHDPEALAEVADHPVNENDLHARHAWLVNNCGDLRAKLEGHPDYYDVKVAGWWVWGLCCWIGSGFGTRQGPWVLDDGRLIDVRQLPHLGDEGRGVNRQLPHLGNAGRGVNLQLPHLGNAGRGRLYPWFVELADRLNRVRVASGDWTRVCGPCVTHKHGLTGVFLDPPYSVEDRSGVYAQEDFSVAHDVREWAIENGDDPLMRIALCGYNGEHAMPGGWSEVAWKAHGGYGSQSDGRGRENAGRERIWFSPHCIDVHAATQKELW